MCQAELGDIVRIAEVIFVSSVCQVLGRHWWDLYECPAEFGDNAKITEGTVSFFVV